jgi:hypothetical protein
MDPYDDPSMMSPYGNMYGSAAMLSNDPYTTQQRHRMMMQAGVGSGMGSPLSEHMLRNMDAARRSGGMTGMRRDDPMMGMHGMPHHSMHGKQLKR